MAEQALVRVAVANDYEVIVSSVASGLEGTGRVAVVDQAVGTEPTGALVDVVLFDPFGRADPGLLTVKRLLADHHIARVAVLADDPSGRLTERALHMGASGVLGKSLEADALTDSLVRIVGGNVVVRIPPGHRPACFDWPGRSLGLSPSEAGALVLARDGLSDAEIAAALFVPLDVASGWLAAGLAFVGVASRDGAEAALARYPAFQRRG